MACLRWKRRAAPVAPDAHRARKEATTERIRELEQHFDAEVWLALKYPPDRVGHDYHMHQARAIAYDILRLYALLIKGLIIDDAVDPIPQYQTLREQIVKKLDSSMPLSPRRCITHV